MCCVDRLNPPFKAVFVAANHGQQARERGRVLLDPGGSADLHRFVAPRFFACQLRSPLLPPEFQAPTITDRVSVKSLSMHGSHHSPRNSMSLLQLERHGSIALLTLNRPQAMNALGAPGDGEAIRSVCEEVGRDASLRCAVLTGSGRAFSAGGDIKAMQAREGVFGGAGTAIRENYRREIHMLSRALYELEIPLIAAVNGPAIGLGCDVACLADMRIASTEARFGVTFLKVGLIPGDGGAWLLQKVIGFSRTAE